MSINNLLFILMMMVMIYMLIYTNAFIYNTSSVGNWSTEEKHSRKSHFDSAACYLLNLEQP